MNYFFSANNKICVNDINKECEMSCNEGVKENGGILFLFLNMGAAPSNGHFLKNAKNYKPLLDGISWIVYCIFHCIVYCCVKMTRSVFNLTPKWRIYVLCIEEDQSTIQKKTHLIFLQIVVCSSSSWREQLPSQHWYAAFLGTIMMKIFDWAPRWHRQQNGQESFFGTIINKFQC